MIKKIAHICISAENLDEAEKFYCGALGFTKKFNFVNQGKIFGFYLQAGESFIEIFQNDRIEKTEYPRIRHFCLETDDIDQFINSARGKGITVTDKKMGADFSWQAWLKDPNGIDFEIHQYTDNSCQLTGADCVTG